MKRHYVLVLGLLLVFFGGLLAWWVQTDGGQIEIKDVRFVGTNGTLMSALLYIPPGVSNENRAPGIVAIHGYINSRETQAGYAIEFARRGYVVLALDQTGHGYSDPPAFANGFGGPDGLAYLRSLDIVDPENIGLEGHSMGGWASLIATAVYPDGYRSIMVQGSSTGTFGAPEGTPEVPRNFGLLFAAFDEFSALMWGSETGAGIVNTEKLQAVFGTTEPVEIGRLYGSIEDGTGRMLFQNATTHPANHLNSEAIGDAVRWMQMTLVGGNGLDANNQVWQWNEIGRLIALIGMVVSMLAFGSILFDAPFFTAIVKPMPEAKVMQGIPRYVGYALAIFIPVLTYFWLQNLAGDVITAATPLFAQNITTGIMFWAVGNGLITLVLFLIWHFTSNRAQGATIANYGLSLSWVDMLKAALAAILIVLFGYLLLAVSDLLFKTDFRFWVVAVKLMGSLHFRIFLGYLPFFVFFFLVLGISLNGQLRLVSAEGKSAPFWLSALSNTGLLVLGIIAMLLLQYIPLMTGGTLPLAEPLLTIVAFQFVPLLTIVALFTTYFFRRTGTVYVGAFVCAMVITWIIVAGQATHFAF
ncbi:MAG: alpha/beta fold hydrolase [Chloroflexi bacterium]|nr:alpha/beta fold hydrolase [Chloroflexota bacterium]